MSFDDPDVYEMDDESNDQRVREEDDSDAAYESYRDDELVALFADESLELRKDTTDRIRQRILDSSPTYESLVTSELARAEILLNAEEPDLAAAFFHA